MPRLLYSLSFLVMLFQISLITPKNGKKKTFLVLYSVCFIYRRKKLTSRAWHSVVTRQSEILIKKLDMRSRPTYVSSILVFDHTLYTRVFSILIGPSPK